MIEDVKRLVPDSEIRTWVGPFQDKELYFYMGREQTDKILKWLAVKPDHKILDIGCGCGRIAIHFIDFLNGAGKYIGVDNNKPMLSFCIDNISKIDPRFQFHYLDVYNGAYSRNGKLSCQEVTFPVEDGSVDIVIMCSVFTHMFLKDIEAYLKEVSRVLKEGGRFVSSLNLDNQFVRKQIDNKEAQLDIKYPVGHGSYTLHQETPEHGFAHDEEIVKRLYFENNLWIKEIKYGCWTSRKLSGEFHDYIIAKKL